MMQEHEIKPLSFIQALMKILAATQRTSEKQDSHIFRIYHSKGVRDADLGDELTDLLSEQGINTTGKECVVFMLCPEEMEQAAANFIVAWNNLLTKKGYEPDYNPEKE